MQEFEGILQGGEEQHDELEGEESLGWATDACYPRPIETKESREEATHVSESDGCIYATELSAREIPSDKQEKLKQHKWTGSQGNSPECPSIRTHVNVWEQRGV